MKRILYSMIEELQQYKRDKNDLMKQYVSERLDKSFSQYDKELQQSILYLTKKHEKSLVKRLKKLNNDKID